MASHLSVTNGLPSPRTPAGPTSLYLGAAQASRRVRDPLVGHVERGWCERGHVERGWCERGYVERGVVCWEGVVY